MSTVINLGRDAILAGVDSLEHASLLEDTTIDLRSKRGVAFSMDVYNGTYTDTIGRQQGYPEVFLQRNTTPLKRSGLFSKRPIRRGVTLLYGTDAAVLPHDMGGWQFAIMVERRHDTHGGDSLGHIGCRRAHGTGRLKWEPFCPAARPISLRFKAIRLTTHSPSPSRSGHESGIG